jgi:autophagy-related protein 2
MSNGIQVTGWARIGEILNDLWTPDVKANQLVDVISGVSPIRSAVNMGSGVADLVLLPIAQYKKDGRIIRGLQKGTNAFIKSTAMEALQLGARLATGTQVILEQAEAVLGGQYKDSITAEALQVGSLPRDLDHLPPASHEAGEEEMISRYAEQPENIKEGVSSAYKTLSRNVKSAGQTILAVPMEVYEQAGREVSHSCMDFRNPMATLLIYVKLGSCSCCYSCSTHRCFEADDRCKRRSQQDFVGIEKFTGAECSPRERGEIQASIGLSISVTCLCFHSVQDFNDF